MSPEQAHEWQQQAYGLTYGLIISESLYIITEKLDDYIVLRRHGIGFSFSINFPAISIADQRPLSDLHLTQYFTLSMWNNI